MSTTETSAATDREMRFGFWRRSYAMLVKEFIQLRRDRVSFAMIVMIPVMQLLLFGYAINTTPRHLPTAVLIQEDSDLARSVLKALENTSYFRFTREVHDVATSTICSIGQGAVRRGNSRAVLSAGCGAAIVRRCWSPPMPPIQSRPARPWARSARSFKPRWHTICSSAIRPIHRSRFARTRATIRRPRRG